MSGRPFDVVVFRDLEAPDAADWNRTGSGLRRTLQLLMRVDGEYRGGQQTSHAALQPAAAFYNDGLKVRAASPAAMEVTVGKGLGFQWAPASNATDIGGVVGLNDEEGAKPIVLTVDKTIAVPAADGTNDRLDIVEVAFNSGFADAESRMFLDVGSDTMVPSTVQKTRSFSLDGVTPSINGTNAINYKTGTPAGSPAEPSVTSGFVKIATIRVVAASTTVPGTRVIDRRLLVAPGGVRVSIQALVDTSTWAITPTVIAPPGVLVTLQTYSNFNGFSLPAIVATVFPAGCLDAGGYPSCNVTVGDGNFANAADAGAPLIVHTQQVVAVNATGALSGGSVVAYWPNPSPDLPIGATGFTCVAIPAKWNGAGPDWTATLPNPMRISFDFAFPVKA